MIDRELLNTMFKKKLDVKRWSKILDENPTPALPIVTKSDIERGFVTRYFTRSVSDKEYVVEIDQVQYRKFQDNPRFITVQLRWKIIGKKETEVSQMGIINRGVKDYNLEQVTKLDVEFKGLRKYITDYTEYWVAETNPLNTYTPEPTPQVTREVRDPPVKVRAPSVVSLPDQSQTSTGNTNGEQADNPIVTETGITSGRSKSEQLSSKNNILIVRERPPFLANINDGVIDPDYITYIPGQVFGPDVRSTPLTFTTSLLNFPPDCTSNTDTFLYSPFDPDGICVEYDQLKEKLFGWASPNRERALIGGYIRDLSNPGVNLEKAGPETDIYNIRWNNKYTSPELEVGFESLNERYTFKHWLFEIQLDGQLFKINDYEPQLQIPELNFNPSITGHQTGDSPSYPSYRFWQDAPEQRAYFKIPVEFYGANIRVSAVVERDNSDFDALNYPKQQYRDPRTNKAIFYAWQLKGASPLGPLVLKTKNELLAEANNLIRNRRTIG